MVTEGRTLNEPNAKSSREAEMEGEERVSSKKLEKQMLGIVSNDKSITPS